MSYSDFTLKRVKAELALQIEEADSLFKTISALPISSALAEILKENVPLARAINTEKARSELIIANILVEVRKQLKHQVSLFSGIEFNVDKDKDLNGFCDFILSASTEQLSLNVPVIAIVEAKNENINAGLGQCIAEMYAAQLFNQQASNSISNIYGVVTTGTAWRFLKLTENIVFIDLDEYPIELSAKILGILMAMLKQEA